MSLAPWYLKAALEGRDETKVLELTINQEKDEILRRIYAESPDIVAFSCYIFNIIQIEAIVKDIKLILPNIFIILGGPEVSFDPVEFLLHNESADFIICGEGETRFRKLVEAITAGKPPKGIDGIAYRDGGNIEYAPSLSIIDNLDTLPSPYTDEMLAAASGKIVYFEASRGCPFHCSYCLSPTAGGVRRFSTERVKNDLMKLMQSDVKQIKFVDRTFNCNPSRAKEIAGFIIDAAKNDTSGVISGKNYHFEAAADLFDDELIDLLACAPSGLFQLEIGIQSFNEKTLEATGRKTDLVLCARNIKKLMCAGNMHIHLDLIAGLPYEDYDSFAKSFNSVFALHPHCIQLGFLKLLRGSKLRHDAQNYGYVYSKLPPYEVLGTPWLEYSELLKLKDIETVVDALYNSGKFSFSLNYIINLFSSAFNLFIEFSLYLKNFYPDGYGIPSRELYNILMSFAAKHLSGHEAHILSELLKFDFFVSDNSCNPPSALTRFEIPNARSLYAAEKGNRRRVHFERFEINPLIYRDVQEITDGTVDLRFEYGDKNPVSGFNEVERL
jgi:radical SAM superfamily enzyme YgiQ (UPF0313 family)